MDLPTCDSFPRSFVQFRAPKYRFLYLSEICMGGDYVQFAHTHVVSCKPRKRLSPVAFLEAIYSYWGKPSRRDYILALFGRLERLFALSFRASRNGLSHLRM